MSFQKHCPGCFREKGGLAVCVSCGYDESAPRSPLFLPHGIVIGGQYRVGRVLGRPGGFGITYLGWDIYLQQRVAIKEYLPRDLAARSSESLDVSLHTREDAAGFEAGKEQFLREARTLAQFDQPSVVRVRNFFNANATAYIVMDYYEGMSLGDYLGSVRRTIPADMSVRLICSVLEGLQYIHERGVVHRDLKPHNVYLATIGRLILLDFGAARKAAIPEERAPSMSVVLTEGYAPLEQYQRRAAQGPWTDVYGAAATLMRMITGQAPPIALDRLGTDPLDLSDYAGIPQELKPVLRRALAVHPQDRYQSAEEFRRDLEACGAALSQEVLDAATDTAAPPSVADPAPPHRLGPAAQPDPASPPGFRIVDEPAGAAVELDTPRYLAAREGAVLLHPDFAVPAPLDRGPPGAAVAAPDAPQPSPPPPEPRQPATALDAPPEMLAPDAPEPAADDRRDAPILPPQDPLQANEAPGAVDLPSRPGARTNTPLALVLAAALLAVLVAMAMTLKSGLKSSADPERRTYSSGGAAATGAPVPVQAETSASTPAATLQGALRRPAMVDLPAGSFRLGDADGPAEARPERSLVLRAFAMGRTEVTVAQYRQFLESSDYRSAFAAQYPCESAGGRFPEWDRPGYPQSDEYPVVCVSAEDAEAYADWLSGQTGARYRLPTEAEWEYAARAGTRSRYWWGAGYDPAQASCAGCSLTRTSPQATGSRPPNPWGLRETSGNVAEWTCSEYARYDTAAAERCVVRGALAQRALRGGSWRQPEAALASAAREPLEPRRRNAWTGFRLVRELP